MVIAMLSIAILCSPLLKWMSLVGMKMLHTAFCSDGADVSCRWVLILGVLNRNAAYAIDFLWFGW